MSMYRPSQIRRFNLKTGDIIKGNIRSQNTGREVQRALVCDFYQRISIRAKDSRRYNFEDMTPIFPNERLRDGTTGRNSGDENRGPDQPDR